MEGFTGYSLPDDLLSGTGLRITSGIMMSEVIPVAGTWLHWLVFGGEYAGEEIIPPVLHHRCSAVAWVAARAHRRAPGVVNLGEGEFDILMHAGDTLMYEDHDPVG